MGKGSYIGGSTVLRIWLTSSASRWKAQAVAADSAAKSAAKRERKAQAKAKAVAEEREALRAAAEARTAERALKANSPDNLARIAERQRQSESRMAKIVVEKRKLLSRRKP